MASVRHQTEVQFNFVQFSAHDNESVVVSFLESYRSRHETIILNANHMAAFHRIRRKIMQKY